MYKNETHKKLFLERIDTKNTRNIRFSSNVFLENHEFNSFDEQKHFLYKAVINLRKFCFLDSLEVLKDLRNEAKDCI